MCYTNPMPAGRWPEVAAMHQGSVFSVKDASLQRGARPVVTANIPKPSAAVLVGSPMWVNELEAASSRTEELAVWPGSGRQEGLPLLAKAQCSNGKGGCVVHLNVYPPSMDSRTAVGDKSVWCTPLPSHRWRS